jgi:hypothetical protein
MSLAVGIGNKGQMRLSRYYWTERAFGTALLRIEGGQEEAFRYGVGEAKGFEIAFL